MKKILPVIFSVTLMLIGGFIILRDQTMLFTRNTAEMPSATFPPTANNTTTPVETTAVLSAEDHDEATIETTLMPTTEPTAEPASRPISIAFMDYDVAATIEPVGKTNDGAMDVVASAEIVSWYQYGACPNEEGNCIIAGHVSHKGQQGLFAILKTVKISDRICMTLENGTYKWYIVSSINSYEYYNVPKEVMSQTGDTRLTLITCQGDYSREHGTSLHRVVVVCTPVDTH